MRKEELIELLREIEIPGAEEIEKCWTKAAARRLTELNRRR